MTNTLTEAELMNGIRTHESSVLEYMYRQYFPIVRGYVMQNTGSADDAGDVFQDGIIALWTNINAGKYESRADKGIGAYLVQICKFRWLERTKSAGFRRTTGWNPDWEGTDENHKLAGMIRQEEISYATGLMAQLGEKCRAILTDFYYEKKSMQEIAAKQQMTPDSAKNEKYRCMQRLKKLHTGNQTTT